jgi:hypothetical protein
LAANEAGSSGRYFKREVFFGHWRLVSTVLATEELIEDGIFLLKVYMQLTRKNGFVTVLKFAF